MTDLIFKTCDENEIAFSDYNAFAEANNYGKLGTWDHLFGCAAEDNDTQEDIAAFVASAVLNPYISIVMIQYSENNNNIDWSTIGTYLEKHNFTDLHSHDKRLTYGRFVPRLFNGR